MKGVFFPSRELEAATKAVENTEAFGTFGGFQVEEGLFWQVQPLLHLVGG